MVGFKSVCLFLLAVASMVCVMPGAADAKSEPGPRYIRADGAAGIYQYVPGKWGMIAVDVVNPEDEPVELLSTIYFDGNPSLQYGRRIWVPANARRFSWHPLLTPANIPEDKSRVDVKSLLMRASTGKDALIESRGGQMLHTGMLPVMHAGPLSGMIADYDPDGDSDGAEQAEDEPRNVVAAMRQSRNLSIMLPDLRGEPLPPSVETLAGLDQLVLASDRITGDAAGLIALRRWLHNGGRVWVMLDRVNPATARRLLGDQFRCHVVDQVELTSVAIVSRRQGREVPAGKTRIFERPVELVRVVVSDARVTHTVNGWPAAFWQTVGGGEVLFTALGPRGWYRDRTAEDPKPKKTEAGFRLIATDPLAILAADFIKPRNAPTLPPEEFKQYVADQIGYRIVGRAAVIYILGGFCLALLIIGLSLASRGALAQLGWIGPVLAMIAALGLMFMGRVSRTAVPSSVVAAQLVEVTPGLNDVRISGLLAMYNQNKSSAPLGAQRGGMFFPDMLGRAGTTRRMIWTDMDRWHWENLTLPSGMRTAPFEYATQTRQPIEARATFGPQGLTGTLSTGPLENVGDAIVVTGTSRNLAVSLDADGSFAGGPTEVLSPGNYFTEAVLDNSQRRRQAIYQKLLVDDAGRRYPAVPTLLAWASPLDMHFTFAEGVQRNGGALVAVPLQFERPAAGTRVLIPSPFWPYRAVSFPGERGTSASYDDLNRKWLGPMAVASRTLLRFECPREILPLRIEEAELLVKISAPSRRMEILALVGGKPVTLAASESPIGLFSFKIKRTDALELDAAGGLHLGIAVGDSQSSKSISITDVGWKIDEVRLNVTAEGLGIGD